MGKTLKPRYESEELKILRILDTRMVLSQVDKQHYLNLKKGYEGEVMFDKMTEKLQCDCYIMNDLLLKVNNTMFQIDSLIIMQDRIHICEIKNYEGDFIYVEECDKLTTKNNIEISNPLNQINRSDSLFRQLLQNLKVNVQLESRVIFINPEFTLYKAPLNKPFILPTQVKKYLKKIDQTPSNLVTLHKKLAEKLTALHVKVNPYTQLPSYSCKQVRKGLTCDLCNSFSIHVNGKKCICGDCGYEENVESAVMRIIRELKLLFPDIKITTNLIYEWCVVINSRKTIRRILDKNFKIVGVHQWAYYE